jgi:hypothetical protein
VSTPCNYWASVVVCVCVCVCVCVFDTHEREEDAAAGPKYMKPTITARKPD